VIIHHAPHDGPRAKAARTTLVAILKLAKIRHPTKRQVEQVRRLQKQYLEEHADAAIEAVKPEIAGVPLEDGARRLISDAAASVIAVADNYGICLLDILAELERYIVQETKVGDARGSDRSDRRRYTLAPRLVAQLNGQPG